MTSPKEGLAAASSVGATHSTQPAVPLGATGNAKQQLAGLPDSHAVRQAGATLGLIEESLASHKGLTIPPLRVSDLDDGSILMEWVAPNWRIGFSSEPLAHQSGWYLVSDGSAGGIHACGELAAVDVDWLLDWVRRRSSS